LLVVVISADEADQIINNYEKQFQMMSDKSSCEHTKLVNVPVLELLEKYEAQQFPYNKAKDAFIATLPGCVDTENLHYKEESLVKLFPKDIKVGNLIVWENTARTLGLPLNAEQLRKICV
jgi:hypothetical protein